MHRDDGSGIDGSTADTSRVVISVVAERLDTPVRIPDTPDATGRRGMRFFADPELAYERWMFYLFATTDGHSEWSGWQIHCLASEDLTHWQDRGVVIDLHDQHLDGSGRTNILPGHAWVPVLAVRDGRYYLYFCGDGQANVAVSDHIDGGYALQGDLARTSSHAARHGFGTGIVAPGIDPAAFRDPQAGRWYLAWGQNRARYSRLSGDMLHIIPEATPDIREAAYLNMREHAGTWTYYLTYSIGDTNDPDYRVAYATALTMEGDGSQWTYRGNPGRQRTPRHTRHRASLHTSGPRHRRMGHRLPLLSAGRHAPARRGPVHGRAHPHRQQARNPVRQTRIRRTGRMACRSSDR